MISINVTFFIQVVNVLILVFLMNLFLYRPIRRIVAQEKQVLWPSNGRRSSSGVETSAAIHQFDARFMEARKKGGRRFKRLNPPPTIKKRDAASGSGSGGEASAGHASGHSNRRSKGA